MSSHPKMKGKCVVKIKEKMINARITVLIGNYDDVEEHIPEDARHHFGEDLSYFARCAYTYRGFSDRDYPYHIIIHSRSAALSVIAHEIVHAGGFIFSELGHKPSWRNDEIMAHFVGHCLEKVEDKLYASK